MVTVDLEKVTFANDSSDTRIDSAAYILEWVYRDAMKNYSVLPAPMFETQRRDSIREEKAKLAFDTFLSDSRALLTKHNKNIAEAVFTPPDLLTSFRILFDTVTVSDSIPVVVSLPYGVETEMDENGNIICYSGDFRNPADAESYLRKVVEQFPAARIEKFVNGVRIIPLPVTVD